MMGIYYIVHSTNVLEYINIGIWFIIPIEINIYKHYKLVFQNSNKYIIKHLHSLVNHHLRYLKVH